MKHNTKSPYEKPLSECPYRCSECKYFDGGDFCRANGIAQVTHRVCNPKDRPVPFPLNCFWWYANNVFDQMSASKIKDYKESRVHLFTAYKILSELPGIEERKEFLNHFYRRGGGQYIDFDKYPEAREIYNTYSITEL
jgi:hypothetical protein